MTALSGGHIIAGESVATVGQGFFAVNPVSGAKLQPAFCEGSAAEVERAAALAEQDFPTFMQVDKSQRAALLDTIAAELLAVKDALIARAELETALPPARLAGELTRTVNQLKMFARFIETGEHLQPQIVTAMPERQPQPRPDLRMTQVPLGPVAVFGASNFPLAFSVAGGDTAAALAAGCPVIVKGHPAHPGTSELAAQAIASAVRKCALPEGIFALLQGSSHQLGAALVSHPAISAVTFTGSQAAGRELFDLAAARAEPIPLFAEMGSVNPIFMLPQVLQVDAERLAQQFAESVCLGVGQFCTKPGLLFAVQGAELDDFVARLRENFTRLPAGTMLHAGIKQNFTAGLERFLSCPDVSPVSDLRPAPAGNCEVFPTLLQTTAAAFLAQPLLADELFGPAALLVVCDSSAQMQQVAQALKGQLSATVHAAATEEADCRSLFAILQRKAGRLLLNSFPTGVEVCQAMFHGGPYPAATDSRFTSVGHESIRRFLRPVCFQGLPTALLPEELR
ncbi:MAG TPA: aldehyde dehydrogenase (NADP(+)) [Malonomonas sp.]